MAQSGPRPGLSMRGRFIVGLAQRLFFWIWANKALPTRLWLRKRLENMEPEQVAHSVRPHLQSKKPDLDGITGAWLPLVSGQVGPNDEYHDTYWSALSSEGEKIALSTGF